MIVETVEGAWHQRFDEAGISASDTFDGRLLRWINLAMGRTYASLPEAQQAYAVARGAANWSSLLHSAAGPAVPVVAPANYVNVLSQRFIDPAQTMSTLLRTCGPSMGGFADGVGLFSIGENATYDTRGIAGPSNDLFLNPLYPWPNGWVPCDISGGKLRLFAGAASLVTGLAAVMRYRAAGTRYSNYGCSLITGDAFQLKGDFVVEARVILPNIVGAWLALWFWGTARTILNPTGKIAEIDFIEFTPADAAGKRTAHANLHGHKADNIYYDTLGDIDTGVDLTAAETLWTLTRFGDVVTWYINRTQIQQKTFPSDYVGKDDWMQMILDCGVGDASYAAFPGIYSSASGQVVFQVRSIDIWKAADKVSTEVRTTRGQADGLGADRVTGAPNTSGVTPGFWGDNGSTTSSGTAKGGDTPAVVASAGADWHRRYYGGKATTANNGNPYDEAGSTAANGGFVSAQRYKVELTFEYGTSGKGYFQLETSGGALTYGSWTGDVITMFGGTIASAVFGTDSYGRRTLVFDYTASATGDSIVGFGPYSNTVGQTILIYKLKIRPYT